MVKNGIVWDASTLDEVWPNAKPYGDYPWVNPDALRTDDRPVTIFDKEPGAPTRAPNTSAPSSPSTSPAVPGSRP